MCAGADALYLSRSHGTALRRLRGAVLRERARVPTHAAAAFLLAARKRAFLQAWVRTYLAGGLLVRVGSGLASRAFQGWRSFVQRQAQSRAAVNVLRRRQTHAMWLDLLRVVGPAVAKS